jgi:hypothetical protein
VKSTARRPTAGVAERVKQLIFLVIILGIQLRYWSASRSSSSGKYGQPAAQRWHDSWGLWCWDEGRVYALVNALDVLPEYCTTGLVPFASGGAKQCSFSAQAPTRLLGADVTVLEPPPPRQRNYITYRRLKTAAIPVAESFLLSAISVNPQRSLQGTARYGQRSPN